jgi:hypothetical protein
VCLMSERARRAKGGVLKQPPQPGPRATAVGSALCAGRSRKASASEEPPVPVERHHRRADRKVFQGGTLAQTMRAWLRSALAKRRFSARIG